MTASYFPLFSLCSFYAVVIVLGSAPVEQSTYSDATSYQAGDTYYITAAWDKETIDNVPAVFAIGDGSVTVANGITYENVKLKPDSRYSVFVRIDIQSDISGQVSAVQQKLYKFIRMCTLLQSCHNA